MDLFDAIVVLLGALLVLAVCAVAVGYCYSRVQERRQARLTPLIGVVFPREDNEDA